MMKKTVRKKGEKRKKQINYEKNSKKKGRKEKKIDK